MLQEAADFSLLLDPGIPVHARGRGRGAGSKLEAPACNRMKISTESFEFCKILHVKL